MGITVLCSIMMMAGLFLMLAGGVGFIQEKKVFSSAPNEVLACVPESKPERFAGQKALGWGMILLSVILPLMGIMSSIG